MKMHSPLNRAEIHCPVFDTTSKIAACSKLREMVWMGKRPAVRRGCQACMSAGKCPVALAITRLAFGHDTDETRYVREEQETLKLTFEVLDKALSSIVLESTLNGYGVNSAERALIASSNERIAAQLKSAPATMKGTKRSPSLPTDKPVSRAAVKSTPRASEKDNALARAAATGDLAAAINQATEA